MVLFNTLHFALFFACVYALYLALSRRGQNTLLLAASQDNITPMEMQHLMLEEMPHATLETFDQVGHNMKVEIPDLLAQRTLEFIGQVETEGNSG